MHKGRIEKDALGELEVPDGAYYGINTRRAVLNFRISGETMPELFIISLAAVKEACLVANSELGLITAEKKQAILQAINEIIQEGKHLDQFPVDIYQTGSGTMTNMNMNEVLANRANEILGYSLGTKYPVNPNDDVNRGQSSNDIIPTTMHLSTLIAIKRELFPAIERLDEDLVKKIAEFEGIIKVARTHLQDAVPIPLSNEFAVYRRQLIKNRQNIDQSCKRLLEIPLGGTAVGTGINSHEDFAETAVTILANTTGYPFILNPVKAESIASHGALVNVSNALKMLALGLLKMANDIRLMSSGPRAGLSELILPANELGSSIMPGKVNPTQIEALIQVCIKVIGNHTVIEQAEINGNILDLNVTKPLIISSLLESIRILTSGILSFTNNCLVGIVPNLIQLEKDLSRNLMVVTNLSKVIGYDKASEIARIANDTGQTIKEVILSRKIEIAGDLDKLLDPRTMV